MYAVMTSLYDLPCTILHTDVVELKGEEKKNLNNREFKCKCCGRTWTENINSPQIIDDDDIAKNINEYYERIITCDKL